MQTPTIARTFIALAFFTALASFAYADPLTTTISGHHDGSRRGNGHNIGSFLATDRDFYRVVSTDMPVPGQDRIYSTTFNHNQLCGLAVLNGETVSVSDGQFNSNTDGLWVSYAHATIQDGQFCENSATGLQVNGNSTIDIAGGLFQNNHGPGVMVHPGATVTVHGGTFSSNQSGIFAAKTSQIQITGGTFSGNTDADLIADGGTITLTGKFRQSHKASARPLIGTLISPEDQLDVMFPGSTTWQTLAYQTTHGGKIVLKSP